MGHYKQYNYGQSSLINWRRIFNNGWQSNKEIFLCLLIPMLGTFNSQPKSETQSPIML